MELRTSVPHTQSMQVPSLSQQGVHTAFPRTVAHSDAAQMTALGTAPPDTTITEPAGESVIGLWVARV